MDIHNALHTISGTVHLSKQYISYIVAVTFIDGWHRSTQRKPPTCSKSPTNFITYCCIEYASPWKRFELEIIAYPISWLYCRSAWCLMPHWTICQCIVSDIYM